MTTASAVCRAHLPCTCRMRQVSPSLATTANWNRKLRKPGASASLATLARDVASLRSISCEPAVQHAMPLARAAAKEARAYARAALADPVGWARAARMQAFPFSPAPRVVRPATPATTAAEITSEAAASKPRFLMGEPQRSVGANVVLGVLVLAVRTRPSRISRVEADLATSAQIAEVPSSRSL